MDFKQKPYVYIFFAHNGPGPFTCRVCEEPVYAPWEDTHSTFESRAKQLHVHHVDDDRNNNEPKNLEAIHAGCHQRSHKIGSKLSQQWRDAISKGLKKAVAEGRRKPKEYAQHRSRDHLGRFE